MLGADQGLYTGSPGKDFIDKALQLLVRRHNNEGSANVLGYEPQDTSSADLWLGVALSRYTGNIKTTIDVHVKEDSPACEKYVRRHASS